MSTENQIPSAGTLPSTISVAMLMKMIKQAGGAMAYVHGVENPYVPTRKVRDWLKRAFRNGLRPYVEVAFKSGFDSKACEVWVAVSPTIRVKRPGKLNRAVFRVVESGGTNFAPSTAQN